MNGWVWFVFLIMFLLAESCQLLKEQDMEDNDDDD